MIKDINHLSFTVSDLDKLVRFYNEALGLEIINIAERQKEFAEKATGIKDAHLKIAYLKCGNKSIELIQYLSPKGKKIDTRTCNVGSAHICFNVEDFDAMIKKLKENQTKFINEPLEIPGGPNKGKKMVYIEDPDSNTIELIEVKNG